MEQIRPVSCALYTRVSSRSQMETDYGSLDSQREKLEAYCKSQDNHTIYRVYEEGGSSGESLDRPALKQLINDIGSGKINCVLVYKIDRLTRSVRDFHTLMDIFDRYNVKFVSITQSFDTQHPMGRLLRNILLDFAQFERDMIADRTRDKMQQRAQKGLWNGGIPPYGYTKKDKKLVKDPNEAPRVRFMFNYFSKTPSIAKLRAELHQRGWYARTDKPWGKTQLSYILRNTIYKGMIQYNEQLYKGQHEPIVEEGLFKMIQPLRRERSHLTTKIKRVFLLKGLLKCGDCGSFMTPHYTQKRRKDGSLNRIAYYRCTKTMNYDNSVCLIKSFNAQQIEDTVIKDLSELSQNEVYLRKSVEELNQDLKRRADPLEKEVSIIEKRLIEIESEIDRYVKALGQGKISVQRLEKEIQVRELDRRTLQSQLEQIKRQINEEALAEYNAELVKQTLGNFNLALGALTQAEKAEALQCILKDGIVYPDKLVLNVFELPEFSPGSQKRMKRLLYWTSFATFSLPNAQYLPYSWKIFKISLLRFICSDQRDVHDCRAVYSLSNFEETFGFLHAKRSIRASPSHNSSRGFSLTKSVEWIT